jgi:DNA gyrase subunit A
VEEYRVQGRGGIGIKVAKLAEQRGRLVGGIIVGEEDEVLVVMESGKVVRTGASEVPAKGRDTMGVIFAKPAQGDSITGVARNADREIAEEVDAEAVAEIDVQLDESMETADVLAPDEADVLDSVPGTGDTADDEVALDANNNGGNA